MHRFVEFGGFVEGDDVDVAVGGADHKHFVFCVDAVDALLTLNGGDSGGGAEIPVFYCFVPTARYQDRTCLAGYVNHADISDRLVVRCYLLSRPSGTEVEEASCLVGAAAYHLSAVLLEYKSANMSGFAGEQLTFDQQQLSAGASCSKRAFPSLPPWALIS